MAAELDLALVKGFRFRCRPGCALCCFTTPAVAPEERGRLLSIAPAAPLLPGPDGFSFIASHPDGGACRLLADLRCSAHSARPFPCRTFPLSVHLGFRPQASIVLSCPGVDLSRLLDSQPPLPPDAPGLEEEIDAVQTELARDRSVGRLREGRRDFERARRQLEREGRWVDPESRRDRLTAAAVRAAAEFFPSPPPPSVDEGLDALPMTYDPTHGRVALAGSPAGWTLLTLSSRGGAEAVLGTYPEPQRPPEIDPGGRRLLDGYLRYVAAREALLGHVLLSLLDDDDRSLEEALEAELGAVAADVLTRAVILGAVHAQGESRLDADRIEQGIRATDAELLDRPTLGRIL